MIKMKKSMINLSSVIIVAIVLSGCIKDKCTEVRTYSYFQPVYSTTAQVKANIKSNSAREIENPGKLFIRDHYIFLNEVDKGIHIINNTNPKNPVNVAFIDIPGNLDLAVNGNALYADFYTDMVTLDISDPLNVIVKKYNEGVFPFRQYGYGFNGDTSKVITDWVRRDTTVVIDCSKKFFLTGMYMDNSLASNSSSANASSPLGKGGSMARFALTVNKLYTVSNSDLNVFNTSKAFEPNFITKVNLGNWAIETIFPMKSKLFIGSQTGMYIYDITNPNFPVEAGKFSHVQSCDPVIADENYAYVTLRSGTACQGFSNQMEVLKLNNLHDVQLVKTYPLANPHGLSKDGDLLFICDGKDGLKIYDAANVNEIKLIKQFKGVDTYDVIAINNIALVVAKDGFYQYDYQDVKDIKLISKMGIRK